MGDKATQERTIQTPDPATVANAAPSNGAAEEQPQQEQEQESQEQEQEQSGSEELPKQEAKASLSNMTQAQIDAIPDEALRAQVQELFNANKQLAAKVKEKDPTWRELAKYGKGTAGIKVSENGAIQITGTRRAYGGLYIYGEEMLLILKNGQKIVDHMKEFAPVYTERSLAAAVKRAAEKKETEKK